MLTSEATSAELSTEIAEIPKSLQTAVRNGYQIAARLSHDEREKAADAVLQQALTGSGNLNDEQLIRDLHLSDNDASRLLLALAVTMALVTQSEVSPAEFGTAGRDHLFDPSEEPIAVQIASKFSPNRSALETSVARSQLANAVLPSLRQLSITMDLRIRFREDSTVENYVPLVLMRLDTDIDTQSVLVQLTRSDIDMIIDKLADAKKEMDQAERLLARAGVAPSEQP